MARLGAVWLQARRWAWIVLLAAIVGALVWLRVASPVSVRVAHVDRGLVTKEAFGRGTVESQREAAVGFDLVGRLSDVLVDEGDRVTLGQELARLDTNQAEADLRSARTGIGAARAALQRLAAEEERARAVLATAEREVARTQSLFEAGAQTAQQRDESTDRLRVARADLDRVLAQRSEATRGIDVAASGAEQRHVTMLRASLLAPFDGLVTRRLREPGDTVAVGSTVLRIVDTERVVVRASVDETVLHELAEDQLGAITFSRGGPAVRGRVSKIAWEADRQTHEIQVELVPENVDRRLAIGQRADVRIALVTKADALRVPISAIHRDEAGPFVLLGRGDRIAVVRPPFGVSGSDRVEVTGDLAEGDALLSPLVSGATLPAGRRWKVVDE